MSGFVANPLDEQFALESDAWKDVTPVKVEEEDAAAVAILFSEEFSEIMGYFRAVLAADEKSERALWQW